MVTGDCTPALVSTFQQRSLPTSAADTVQPDFALVYVKVRPFEGWYRPGIAKHATDHVGFSDVPATVTHCSPDSVVPHLHSALSAMQAVDKTNCKNEQKLKKKTAKEIKDRKRDAAVISR